MNTYYVLLTVVHCASANTTMQIRSSDLPMNPWHWTREGEGGESERESERERERNRNTKEVCGEQCSETKSQSNENESESEGKRKTFENIRKPTRVEIGATGSVIHCWSFAHIGSCMADWERLGGESHQTWWTHPHWTHVQHTLGTAEPSASGD